VNARSRPTAPEAALTLGLLYVGLSILHVWQAARHATPTVFSDEIEFTQLSRSIADTGRPSFRDGAPSGLPSLYPYLAAPAWWLDSVGQSYAAIKTLGSLAMTAAVFPAYGLARLVAGRPLALAAAAGAGAAPALAYGPFLVDEPIAYPLGTLALLLLARALLRPTVQRFGAAAAACLVATAARTQLVVLLLVLALAAGLVLWRSDAVRRRRRGWTRGDLAGAAILAFGALLVGLALVSHRSYTWYVSTTFYKGRMLDFGTWAVASLAIGVGLVPLVATLAALVPARGRAVGERERAFALTTVLALGAFGAYAAVKGAYLSTRFASLVPERNVIYLTPLLFAGTAWLLQRRAVRPWALAAAAALVAWLVVETPYGLSYPNYEAHGFAILALANRVWRWDETRIEHALLLLTLAASVALLLHSRLGARAAAALAALLLAGTLTWATTTQVYAARGENELASRFYGSLPKPADWLDRTDGGAPAVFLGQGIDANPIWSLEFWNRSLRRVWSLDATAPGPGTVVTADLGRPDGTLTPEPRADWVVAGPGVSLVPRPGDQRVGDDVLQRLHGPIQLASAVYGVSADGWMGGTAAYDRYDVRPGQAGLASIVVSRTGWCGPDKPGQVTIRLGPLGVSEGRRPELAGVTQVVHDELNSCEQLPFLLRAPPGPWRVEVTVDPTFSPHELDPSLGDARQLGAQISFDYRPL
jgi:hypothetical protein